MLRREFFSVLAGFYILLNDVAHGRENHYEFDNPRLKVAYDGQFRSYRRWLEILLPYKPRFIITGTFYADNKPLGLIARDKQVVNSGMQLDAATLSYAPLDINAKRNPEAETQLGGLAWLVREGEIHTPRRKTYPREKRRRLAIGTKGSKLVIAHSMANVEYMADFMKSLKCDNAAAVDGGGSAFLYKDGI